MRCKINRQTFRGIPGFYSTSSYTAVIFSAHLVAVKCEVFITTGTREIQLRARPATQLTRPVPPPTQTHKHTHSHTHTLPANRLPQCVAHARRFK